MTNRAYAKLTSLGGVAMLAALACVTSCASPDVCRAIGYSQTLTVDVTGVGAKVSQLLVCDSSGCPADPTATGGGQYAEAISASDGDTWTATLFYFSEPLTVRLIDSQGTTITEDEVTPDWVRTGGTEECGGPAAATVSI